MKVVMSIVADSPKGSLTETTSDGNTAINNIVKQMEGAIASPTSRAYKPVLERAVYVRDIAVKLSKIDPKPDIIQIIGHGSAGRIELGSYWTTELEPNLGPAVLDSNPDSYGMLLEVIPKTSKIFLLGCDVGSAAPGGYVASGRALLFDMEDMTSANVYAADDLVYPELFTDGFLYTGSLVTSTGKPANPASLASLPNLPTDQPTIKVEVPTELRLKEVLSSPAFGARVAPTAAIRPDASYFNRYILADPQPKGLLAMAEIVFSAENYVRVEAICCLRYLRAVTKEGHAVYFRPPPPPNDPRPSGVPPRGEHFDSAKPALDKLRGEVLAM